MSIFKIFLLFGLGVFNFDAHSAAQEAEDSDGAEKEIALSDFKKEAFHLSKNQLENLLGSLVRYSGDGERRILYDTAEIYDARNVLSFFSFIEVVEILDPSDQETKAEIAELLDMYKTWEEVKFNKFEQAFSKPGMQNATLDLITKVVINRYKMLKKLELDILTNECSGKPTAVVEVVLKLRKLAVLANNGKLVHELDLYKINLAAYGEASPRAHAKLSEIKKLNLIEALPDKNILQTSEIPLIVKMFDLLKCKLPWPNFN